MSPQHNLKQLTEISDTGGASLVEGEDLHHPDAPLFPDEWEIESHQTDEGWLPFNADSYRLAHPLIWLAIATLIFVVANVFPPSLYESWFGDRNYMFFDLRMFSFNCLSIGLLVYGLWVGMGGTFTRQSSQSYASPPLASYPLATILSLIGMSMANLLGFYLFIKAGGMDVWRMAWSGQDGGILYFMKQVMDTRDLPLWLPIAMVSSSYIPLAFQIMRTSARSSVTRWLFYLFLVSYALIVLTIMRRNFIARPVFGCLLIYLTWPTLRSLTTWSALRKVAIAGVAMIVVFLGFSAIRRNRISEQYSSSQDVIRYLVTPYNSQSSLMHGYLKIDGQNTGYYWSMWFWTFPIAEQFFDLEKYRERIFGPKPPFGAEERLNFLIGQGITTVTSFSAFASSYFDFGWLGVFPFFGLGIVGGLLWKSFLENKLIGMMFYPPLAYALLELRANILFPSAITNYTLIAFIFVAGLCLLERLLFPRRFEPVDSYISITDSQVPSTVESDSVDLVLR